MSHSNSSSTRDGVFGGREWVSCPTKGMVLIEYGLVKSFSPLFSSVQSEMKVKVSGIKVLK